MLSSIHPFGERSRNNRYVRTVTAYLVASIAGGMTSGLVAGLIGVAVDVSTATALAILATATMIGLLCDLGVGGLRVPSWHRQVNERWLDSYRGWVVGVGFGYQLGLGVVTIVTTSAVWSMWVAATLSGSIRAAVSIGAVFGTVRGSFILAAAAAKGPSELRLLHGRLAATAPTVARTTTVLVAASAALALAGAVNAA